MTKIKVLGLDDDNHPMCFVTRGSYYENAVRFMRDCLLDAHSISYDLRIIRLTDLPEGLTFLDPVNVETMFDLLTCENHPYRLCQENPLLWQDREKAFDLFWKYGEKECYYV